MINNDTANLLRELAERYETSDFIMVTRHGLCTKWRDAKTKKLQPLWLRA